jgi:quinol monooxygenase YgiN
VQEGERQMVVVEGIIDVDPSQRDEFLEGRREGLLATRDEPGCIEYAFSADLIDPGRIRIFERWATPEDLDTHLGLMAQRPAPAPGSVQMRGAEFRRYEIASMGPLNP